MDALFLGPGLTISNVCWLHVSIYSEYHHLTSPSSASWSKPLSPQAWEFIPTVYWLALCSSLGMPQYSINVAVGTILSESHHDNSLLTILQGLSDHQSESQGPPQGWPGPMGAAFPPPQLLSLAFFIPASPVPRMLYFYTHMVCSSRSPLLSVRGALPKYPL